MLHDIVKKDSTNRSVTIRIVDSSDGTPETGVEHDTSGIDLWYRREGAAKVSITEAALADLTTAHTDGGIEHIGDGYYRLDLPDAAYATGAEHVDFGGTVTGMVVIGGRVRLVDFDPEAAADLGLTAIAAILADTNELQTDDVPGLIAALNDIAASDVLAEVIENSLTVTQVLRLILAASAGKLSGAATTSVAIRDTADSKDRISATVDADGNRSAVTLDAS